MAIRCNEPIYSPSSKQSAAPLLVAAVDFPQAQLSSIIGPSGIGKSSLLHHLAQLDTTRSNVSWFDQKVTDLPLIQRAKSRAYMPQSTALALNFRAIDIVLLGQPEQTLAEQALNWCEAEHLSARFYQELSGGEKQRVLLARAIGQLLPNLNEKLLLLDEPVGALDIGLQHKLYQRLQHLSEENGLTTVVVEHDIHLARLYPTYFGVLGQFSDEVTSYQEHDALTVDVVMTAYNVDHQLAMQYF